ncbi:heterokaryon incompatibility protein-domain-containing protein [Nemania sp. FL0916]|nr:heterokaryon incompatibility protein-domain-containing protein [Nemania sp. FL0916]
MRLINTRTFVVHEFSGDSIPDYAILSHTWGEDECTLQDVLEKGIELLERKNSGKIRYCCQQAVDDEIGWAWVDTCCIDKTSTAELSEAINSMFKWYRDAKICYAYLADVKDIDEFATSRWWTRGWTLQELLAPQNVQFYSSDWTLLGSKSELQDVIQKITGIDVFVLSTGNFSQACIAKRMSWAAKRSTTRIEDQAYSLMGIFDVNMPLIYGEGKKAFLRLQQEILRISDDQTIFAWGATDVFPDMHGFHMARIPQMHSLFADSPANFRTSHEIMQAINLEDSPPPIIHGNGVRVQYPVCEKGPHDSYEFIVLACTTRGTPRAYLGVPVKSWDKAFYARCGQLILIFPGHWKQARGKLMVVKEPLPDLVSPRPSKWQIIRVPHNASTRKQDLFVLDEVFCLPHASYNQTEHSISLSPSKSGPHTALFFSSSAMFEEKAQSRAQPGTGIFPMRSFAVVLGVSKYPWTVFIPILRDAHEDEDFHRILNGAAKMVTWCMRKDDLKQKLRLDDLAAFPRRRRFFDMLLAVWGDRTAFFYRNLEISVDVDIGQVNLVDEAVFVLIDIYQVWIRRTIASQTIAFTHSADTTAAEGKHDKFKVDWATFDQLEWPSCPTDDSKI